MGKEKEELTYKIFLGVEKQLRVAAQLKLTKTVCLTEAAVLSEANDTVDNPFTHLSGGFPSSWVRVSMEPPALFTFY